MKNKTNKQNYSPRSCDKTLTASRETGIEEIACLTCQGGWPAICSRSSSVSLNLAKEYLASVVEADVSDLGPNRSPVLIRSVLRSYARFVSSQRKMTEILKDVNANNHISIDILQSCIDMLKAMFVIDELDAWNLV
jgi:predicted AAA+ superfamily ATPase